MPIHMDGAVTPVVAWIWNVSQRNAPGAINAIAFMVNPVKPNVDFIRTGLSDMIWFSCFAEVFRSWYHSRNPIRDEAQIFYRAYKHFISPFPFQPLAAAGSGGRAMKLLGLLLLLAGWGITLAAVVLLKTIPQQGAFTIAGMAVEALGLTLVIRAHRTAAGGME
jgi:hypothetical protein